MHRLIVLLKAHKNFEKAKSYLRFYKTGFGQYGSGDVFWGISMPEQRKIATQCLELALDEIDTLVKHSVHEVRMTSFLILTEQYLSAVKQKDAAAMKKIFDFYISHAQSVNNWDLVDCTAPIISGHYTFAYPKKQSILRKFAKSNNLWERRIAIVSSYYFIRQKQLTLTFELADALLKDTHDLIHKAVGWMLREAGKKDEKALNAYLKTRYTQMPRTMLRYAIEKFTDRERRQYLLR